MMGPNLRLGSVIFHIGAKSEAWKCNFYIGAKSEAWDCNSSVEEPNLRLGSAIHHNGANIWGWCHPSQGGRINKE